MGEGGYPVLCLPTVPTRKRPARTKANTAEMWQACKQKHTGFVEKQFPSLFPATKCSARKAAASLGTSGFSYLRPSHSSQLTELEPGPRFKMSE